MPIFWAEGEIANLAPKQIKTQVDKLFFSVKL